MLRCKVCGMTDEILRNTCPHCGAEYSLSSVELDDLLEEAKRSYKRREYEEAVDIYKFLARLGVTKAEREYGIILEKGALVPRDLDGAMKYFYSAAKKNDPTAAYKYSRLAARTSDKASSFWLAFAALLGCRDAFAEAAQMYSDMGDESTATYYFALAADCNDTDAIVTMARRYYEGIGAERHDAYAKWYMDKLPFPPLHAIKLALKLRSVTAKLPPEPVFEEYGRILRGLARDAKKYGLATTHFYLSKLLADGGGAAALYTLGTLYVEGDGTEQSLDEGIRLLQAALLAGSPDAAVYLGDLFVTERFAKRDIEKALGYYKQAASLGQGGAYEKLGDIFYEGRLVKPNPAYAISLYELGTREGDESCRAKARALRDERESYYFRARECEKFAPEEAFENYAKSTAMGYLPAHSHLARCFELGIGAKKDRRSAFIWYEAAVEHGDTDALYDLGRCYSRGIGTAFNFDKASEFLKKAKKYGSRHAEAELLRIYENKNRHMVRSLFSTAMRLIYKKKFTPAVRMLEVSSRADDPISAYTLACLYEFGLGAPTNRTRAFELYNQAFEGGLRDPRQAYKLKILKMAR